MTTAEDVLALIESQNQIADLLDGVKTKLEVRGWSATSAETASIATMSPLVVQAGLMGLLASSAEKPPSG